MLSSLIGDPRPTERSTTRLLLIRCILAGRVSLLYGIEVTSSAQSTRTPPTYEASTHCIFVFLEFGIFQEGRRRERSIQEAARAEAGDFLDTVDGRDLPRCEIFDIFGMDGNDFNLLSNAITNVTPAVPDFNDDVPSWRSPN